MARFSAHRLLRLLPALLVALLFASPPALADGALTDAFVGIGDLPHGAAQPLKAADHASKKPRQMASLEEFVGIDDDAEQYLKPLAALLRPLANSALVAAPVAPTYRSALPTHRVCAAFPTGPPHA